MATALAVTSIVLAGVSIKKQQEADINQRKAGRAQRRQAEIANARQRRIQAAKARRARALVKSQAATSGAIGSSAVAGALSSISAQAQETLGFSGVQVAGGVEISSFEAKAASAQTQAGIASTLSAVPGQLGVNASSIFDTPTTT